MVDFASCHPSYAVESACFGSDDGFGIPSANRRSDEEPTIGKDRNSEIPRSSCADDSGQATKRERHHHSKKTDACTRQDHNLITVMTTTTVQHS